MAIPSPESHFIGFSCIGPTCSRNAIRASRNRSQSFAAFASATSLARDEIFPASSIVTPNPSFWCAKSARNPSISFGSSTRSMRCTRDNRSRFTSGFILPSDSTQFVKPCCWFLSSSFDSNCALICRAFASPTTSAKALCRSAEVMADSFPGSSSPDLIFSSSSSACFGSKQKLGGISSGASLQIQPMRRASLRHCLVACGARPPFPPWHGAHSWHRPCGPPSPSESHRPEIPGHAQTAC